MQTLKILQAVILMLIVAWAASCAIGKQYSKQLLAPRKAAPADSMGQTVRFLQWGDDTVSTVQGVPAFNQKQTHLTDTIRLVSTVSKDSLVTGPPSSPSVNKSANGVRTKRTRNDPP